jgi:histidine ammonia-lyase
LDFLAPLRPGKRGQQVIAAIRAVSPKLEKDRVLAHDFSKAAQVISSGKLAEALG